MHLSPKRKTARSRKRTTRRKPTRRKTRRSHSIKPWLIGLLLLGSIIGAYYWLVVRPAQLSLPAGRAIATPTELQIALARQGCSPGSIDGAPGSQTKLALKAFQTRHGLEPTGALDPATSRYLKIEDPVFAELELTQADFQRIAPKPRTWRERQFLNSMAYNSILEMVAEHSLSDPDYVKALNPNINWNALNAGNRIRVPYLKPYAIPQWQAQSIQIHLALRQLQLLDADGALLFHCPVSIARRVDKRPSGQLQVKVRVEDPNYTFNPAILKNTAQREGITSKFIIPPGPNNPVGTVWIGLNLPSYGIHGTPVPEQVGRTESSGCFRLANWNAESLVHAIHDGIPVFVNP